MKSDAQLRYQNLLDMQNKERKLKDDIEAMRLDQEEKIKKENEMDDLKL